MNKSFFISKPFIYAPGLESEDDVKLWANDQKDILFEKTSPSLSYTNPLFRRRLSQISKMTIEVIHQLIETTGIDKNTKIVFSSFRGEIDREFKLNKSIIEDKMILPAGFSLSVFNTPVGLATIACQLKGGYNTVFPSYDNFKDGIMCAAAPVLSEKQKQIIFVYADELIPDEYKKCDSKNKPPIAFATIISSEKSESLDSVEYSIDDISTNVYEFIKSLAKSCYN